MEKKVKFKVGEQTLRGSLFIPKGKGPFPAVILFHGSGSSGETYFEVAKKLAENGILGFAFNFRGCGISDGKFGDETIGAGLEDARSSVNFLISQFEVDKDRLGISGSSYGGFMASLISSDYNFKSMLLIAPASYAPSTMNLKQGTFISEMPDFNNSKSYKEIGKFKGDLLVIRCEFDETLPPGMAEKYIESASFARVEDLVLKGATHKISINPQAREVLITKIVDWFSKTL